MLDHALIVRAKKLLNATTTTIITTVAGAGVHRLLTITIVVDMRILNMKSHTTGVIVMALNIGVIKMREMRVEKRSKRSIRNIRSTRSTKKREINLKKQKRRRKKKRREEGRSRRQCIVECVE